jgi:PncC family amidohydrolase
MSKEFELVKKLTKKGYTISTAESCTGGLLSAAIVNVSGASEVFYCGFVTYANAAKEKYVKVCRETLDCYSAVSEQTAAEMAAGCAAEAKADIGLSTTGIAGPDGGTLEKPVGLVYIGCSLHGVTKTSEFVFAGSRDEVRRQAVDAALALAIHCIDEERFCEKDS